MNILKIDKETFHKFFETLKLQPRYKEDFLFDLFSNFVDSVNEGNTPKPLDVFTNINPFELCLYLISEFVYFTNKLSDEEYEKISNDDHFLTLTMSSALDKYLTNEKVNLNDVFFASKYSPNISTIRTYLNFMKKIMNNYDGNIPNKTLVTDYLSKGINISRCALDLLEDGFESEAFATWRTLHETECILTLFINYGKPMVDSYLKHMNYAMAFRKIIKDEKEIDNIFVQIKSEMKDLDLKSKDTKKYIEYGYLSVIPETKNDVSFKFNFRDGVEKYAGLSSYSSLYEYSSEIAHSSPLMIYSNQKMLFHLTLALIYEVFFRLEKIFSSIYLSTSNDDVKKQYNVMRELYYHQMLYIYSNEKEMYLSISKPNEK